MKLETFFEKFDHFADAPDAVAKMRELVLDLAVQGNVADQDPKDEPAAKLLQRLVALKLATPLSGRSGRSKEEPVAIEPNGEGLPDNWVNTTIGEVLYVIRGASPRPKGDPQYFSETRTPYHWVKISDIRKHGQNGLLMDTDEFLTEAGMRKSVLLPKGTLVLTNSATIGVPIVLGIDGCCIHDGYLAFPNFPHDLLSQKFLLYLFHTLKKHAERNARGLAQLNLNTDLVRSFPFGLPPLAEQKRIVAKVDELMALCDRLEAQQQERETRHAALARASLARFADAPTPANLHFLFHPSYAIPPADLRKSILTLAVQGKLVPQDPNDEPAEELLARVSASLPNKKSENPFLGEIEASITDESEYELPYGWSWLPLGHVGIWATGCGFPTQYQGEADKEFLFCKVSDMNLPGNEVEIHSTVHTIDADVMKKIRARANPPGTVIFPKIGGAIATHKRRLVIKPTIIDNNCSGIQPIGLTDDSWLLLFMRNLDLTKYQSGTSVPAVSQGSLDPIRIGLPPLAEQRRIVAKVEQLMALVDALEQQLAASRATAAKLLDALVAELTAA